MKRELFCRAIAMRDSDAGEKHTITFKHDDILDRNELVTFQIVYFNSMPSVWKEILDNVSRNDRITLTIESGDRQEKL